MAPDTTGMGTGGRGGGSDDAACRNGDGAGVAFLIVRGTTGGGAVRVRGTLMAEMGGKLEANVGAFVKVGVGGSSIDGISLLGGTGMLGRRLLGGLAGGRSNVTDALDDDDLDDATRRIADGSALAMKVVG